MYSYISLLGVKFFYIIKCTFLTFTQNIMSTQIKNDSVCMVCLIVSNSAAELLPFSSSPLNSEELLYINQNK